MNRNSLFHIVMDTWGSNGWHVLHLLNPCRRYNWWEILHSVCGRSLSMCLVHFHHLSRLPLVQKNPFLDPARLGAFSWRVVPPNPNDFRKNTFNTHSLLGSVISKSRRSGERLLDALCNASAQQLHESCTPRVSKYTLNEGDVGVWVTYWSFVAFGIG